MRSPTKTWNGARYAPEKWERNGMAPLKLSAWLIRSYPCRKLMADGWRMISFINYPPANWLPDRSSAEIMDATSILALTIMPPPRRCASSQRCISKPTNSVSSMLSKEPSTSSSNLAIAWKADGRSTGLYPRISLAIRTISPSMTTWCSIWCVSFRIYQNRKATSQVSWMMPPARNARHNGTRR